MKKSILTLIALLSANIAAINAAPKLIGHRGSYWGVENSAEAFIAGAEKGYSYLETDIKVAGDGTFVLTHDDETSRLGGNLTITTATIEQLKAETYTQTRGGITYEGKICTLEEYLQICKDYGVIPFIELKWATGINNNDCSNLKRMVDTVIEYGFENDAIINTSMKPCLEFIRENYPDFRLMFLCNTNWESNFDWCVEHNIGAYIQTGCFDRNTVTKFHEKNLKVGVWTVNTAANYSTYGNYGCDFIAVDYLDPVGLPELDPFSSLVPNKIDYPDHDGIIQATYTFEESSTKLEQSFSTKKAIAHENNIFLLSTDGNIAMLDMNTQTYTRIALNTEHSVPDISIDADGRLILYVDHGNNTATIYAWNQNSELQEITAIDNCSTTPAFCFSGTTDDWKIYYASSDGIRGISSTGAIASNTIALTGQSSLSISPFSRNNIIIDSPTTLPAEYSFDWESTTAELCPFMAMADNDGIDIRQTSLSPFRYGAKIYAPVFTGNGFRLLDMSKGLKSIEFACDEFGSFTLENDDYIAGFANVKDGDIHVYCVHNANVAEFVAKGEVPEGNTGPTDFHIEKLWSYTDKEGNAPEHIDGTNAQQGAACNGTFYINDCSDKLIYIYTSEGLAGTLPGGAGWGTAIDDAGNIIVRDDKQTGTTHRVLIYPAGTMPDDGIEATAIDFETLDAGQTNFISASGDVLGDGGYIYMFPNKQTVVNLIKIANGKFVETTRSENLSIESSTAGYVVPINNNPENWLYMVRNNGIYQYNGSDAGLLLGGSSTTPPSRNSTCGAEIFTLSNHEILVYNSGKNYTGGFTIKDLTDNKVIATIEPIGTKGYETGGNYSVSNWMHAEKIDPGSYYLYQYCPANGIAAYRFYDANYDAHIDSTPDATEALKIYPNPATTHLHIEGISGGATIFSATGAVVMQIGTVESSNIDISGIPQGIYIVKSATGATGKFIKR